MPCDYRNYPIDWHSRIRPAILARANHCCEACGARNYSVVTKQTRDCLNHHHSYAAAREELTRYDVARIIIVLTIAHLDHCTLNNHSDNLKALCQRCHNRHDAPHRAHTRHTRRRALIEASNPSFALITSLIHTA